MTVGNRAVRAPSFHYDFAQRREPDDSGNCRKRCGYRIDIPFQQGVSKNGAAALLRYIKRIHLHRIFVNEGHLNQQGHKIKLYLCRRHIELQ